MKKYNIVFVLLSFLFINAQKYCNYSINPLEPSDCHNKLSEEEKNNGIIYCCFLIIDDNITCQGLTQEDYNEIENNVVIAKSNRFLYQIECFKHYIKVELLYLIILFFIIFL